MNRRNEPFRVLMEPPLNCQFQIVYVNGKFINSSIGSCEILDISPGGLKIKSSLNLYLEKELKLKLSFNIDSNFISQQGQPLWIKRYGNYFLYGVKLEQTGDEKELIINSLKVYSRTKKR
ncbi:PilZ domain-containing protein [Bacillus sp. Marseille-P3661]|uniref:PilZ domain-containing protein n=1 Tax=Bacillus sp. Marseille-P3661 TaxID=1936234 RepID=UPI000C81AC9B|nr:PilZ domain-containing protein [Bacillus sp. Marseille-P3661]